MTDLIADEARRRWDYDPDTGVLRWKISPVNSVKIGDVAGQIPISDGYLKVRWNGKAFSVHRIIWLIVYGEWPPDKIDHINGDRIDNRIANLRCVSVRQNSQNKQCHRDGHLAGTKRDARRRKNPWQAAVTIEGKRKHLGCFPTQQQAYEAYVRALEGTP
jgi:hypothetical protein